MEDQAGRSALEKEATVCALLRECDALYYLLNGSLLEEYHRVNGCVFEHVPLACDGVSRTLRELDRGGIQGRLVSWYLHMYSVAWFISRHLGQCH